LTEKTHTSASSLTLTLASSANSTMVDTSWAADAAGVLTRNCQRAYDPVEENT
jgi:hypothetical protein